MSGRSTQRLSGYYGKHWDCGKGNMRKAFKYFFRRVREHAQEPGYPRFKSRNRYDSFTYPDGAGWKLTVGEQGKKIKGTLTLSKIGTASVTMHWKLEGKIKTCTIKREVD